MAAERRVTQADLAKMLKLSQATISRALSGSQLLPSHTIAEVRAAAEKLGYRPDPALVSLSAYRKAKSPPDIGQCLAWFTAVELPQLLKDSYHALLFKGAKNRAAELGYRLEPIWTREPGTSVSKLLKILAYRKVEGILFPPQLKSHAHHRLVLDNFSVVAIGYSLYSPFMDQVTHSHFLSMVTTYRKLYALGYRRIGLVLTKESDARTAGLWRAAYSLQQYAKKASPGIPVLQAPENDIRAFDHWLKEWKPDALMIHFEREGARIDQLRKLKLYYPEKIGVALLSLPTGFEHFSGINELTDQLGAFAVDTLVAKIRNHQRGIPAVRSFHFLEGIWHDGDTTSRQRMAKS